MAEAGTERKAPPQKNARERDSELARIKLQPQSLEAEQSVLGGLMISAEAWDGVAEMVSPEDFYRLEHESDIEALGVFDRIDGSTVVLSEWGDRSPRMMSEADLVVHLAVTGENTRRIDIHYRDADAGLVAGLEEL